jgi:glycosyltransferase involved in cell wall biosynthesis
MDKKIKFSVLMPVYCKENPIFFKQALNSIMQQTLMPNEIVIVKDGPD